jgi:hypothetical protein
MRKLITTIILLVMTLPILAQERVVEHIDGNLYSYKMYDGKQLTQRGYYKNINGTLFEHGIWKDNFGTTALFEKGKMVWIKPKGDRKYTSDEIELNRLKRKVQMLEQKLTSL